MPKPKHKPSLSYIKDIHIYAILAAICVAGRVPFLNTFELVSYDGTYYLGQARTMFGGHMTGAFPIGYPLLVKIFQIVLRDYQVAGMAVSFLASVGSVIVVYRLAARFTGRALAFLAAAALALNPLFVRLSLMTMSESAYIFWVLLGLLMFTEKKWLPFGLAMGMAVITRPEALVVVGLLGLSRIRAPKQAAVIAASFLAVYAVNVAVLSANQGRLVVVSKSDLFGSGAANWKLREASVEYEGRAEVVEEIAAESKHKSVVTYYIRRMPVELRLLIVNAWPVVVLFALFAMKRRKYLFLMTGLVAFFVTPLFAPRVADRFILPYIPILYVLAVLAVGELRQKQWRLAAVALLVVTAVALPVVNRAALLVPEDPLVLNTKTAALELRDRVKPGDKVAARKPFFAFYTGGNYVEIPMAPYEDIMAYLLDEDVKFIELHQATIHPLRPMLRTLMYSTTVINGEVRFRQAYFDPSGEMVFERTGIDEPLRWTRVTPPGGSDIMPSWSPDGRRIAFRSKSSDGAAGIYVIEPGAAVPQRVAEVSWVIDALAWSPDGRQIAFADGEEGGLDIFAVDVETGDVETLVDGPGNDASPSWAPGGKEMVFYAERTGTPEIWAAALPGGEPHQITTDGNNVRPAISPTGDKIAWIRLEQGVVVMDSSNRRILRLQTPRRVRGAPAWSPDGRYIAVTADDWGSRDIYLLTVDGTDALLLTKNPHHDVMPSWSPDGRRIALSSAVDVGAETLSIWMIEGLKPFLERLESPQAVRVFTPPDSR
jgi:TolB protein